MMRPLVSNDAITGTMAICLQSYGPADTLSDTAIPPFTFIKHMFAFYYTDICPDSKVEILPCTLRSPQNDFPRRQAAFPGTKKQHFLLFSANNKKCCHKKYLSDYPFLLFIILLISKTAAMPARAPALSSTTSRNMHALPGTKN